jgi:16S rRNA (guanine966-N2)-methyltransferase
MLRIIAGRFRGRSIKTFEGKTVRPSGGLVRGVIFNVLAGQLEGRRVLDLYAGSGALGLEALSRGASEAVFVESNRLVADVLKENLSALQILPRSRIVQQDCLEFLSSPGQQFGLILADPPYRHNVSSKIVTLVCENELLEEGGILVLQHHPKEEMALDSAGLGLWKSKRHGKTQLDFLIAKEDLS